MGYCNTGSTINANGANCSNAGSTGICRLVQQVNAVGANCSNAGSNWDICKSAGSTINAMVQ